MAMTINIEPLSPVLGASIQGIDLRNPVDLDSQELLYQTFINLSVLCFGVRRQVNK